MGKAAVKERKTEAAATAPDTDVATCRHHWIIETPRGALSDGRCKLCGEQRQFRNSANDYIWDDDSSSSSGYGWGGARSTPKVSDDDDGMTASTGSGSGVAMAV